MRNNLPAKFTQAERDAYDWLCDNNIRPWLVDLKTKEVNTPGGKVKSLIEYAKMRGMK